ncbi:MAG: hypothetical protein R3C68_00655 [Myxococcota bacterium]
MGGEIEFDASGVPMPQAGLSETMCYGLTVPTGSLMPAGGWPVLIYAHGTGGNYRSFANSSLAAVFADLGFAVISFDNVMHGPRQNTSFDPALWNDALWEFEEDGIGRLFFNVVNPRAARDNVLQGAADLFWLTRLLRSNPVLNTTATGDIKFDANQLYFFGHSQGTVIAAPYFAEETDLQAAVFSGAGADLALSILNKKEPVDLSQSTALFLGDQGLSRIHPMIGLMGLLFGPSDALAYASGLRRADGTAITTPYLQFSGVGDSFTPDATHAAMLEAMGVPIVGGGADVALPGVVQVDQVPANRAGALRYVPDGAYNGHFVVFEHARSEQALRAFLGGALNNGLAEISR